MKSVVLDSHIKTSGPKAGPEEHSDTITLKKVHHCLRFYSHNPRPRPLLCSFHPLRPLLSSLPFAYFSPSSASLHSQGHLHSDLSTTLANALVQIDPIMAFRFQRHGTYHSAISIMWKLIFVAFRVLDTTGDAFPACTWADEVPFLG